MDYYFIRIGNMVGCSIHLQVYQGKNPADANTRWWANLIRDRRKSQGNLKMKEADWRFIYQDGDVLQSGPAQFTCKQGLCLRLAFLTSTHYATPGEAR